MAKKRPAADAQKQDVPAEVKEDIQKEPATPVQATFDRQRVVALSSQEAQTLYDQSRWGEPKDGKFIYSLAEALFLIEKGKMHVKINKKNIDADAFAKKAQKFEPNFSIRYIVFKDMRSRGYIVKTALKFGADFRVYDRGVKPGEDHAKWILYPVHESEELTWYAFSAKNRVAHSTRKRLLLAVVDDENDVTYYEISWKRP